MTEEKFRKFIEIRDSGVTNMWDAKRVVELADGVLTEEDVVDIIHDWHKLAEKYGDPSR